METRTRKKYTKYGLSPDIKKEILIRHNNGERQNVIAASYNVPIWVIGQITNHPSLVLHNPKHELYSEKIRAEISKVEKSIYFLAGLGKGERITTQIENRMKELNMLTDKFLYYGKTRKTMF